MRADLRETPEYAAIEEQLRKLHAPAFGRPHALCELHATADGARIAVTGAVFDELAGSPRTAVYTCQDGELQPISAACGSARWGRFSPDGSVLAFLSDRGRPGVFQLFLLADNDAGDAIAAPTVAGTIEYAHWSPDGRQLLLGVAELGADLAGGQGSSTAPADANDELPDWHPHVEAGEDSAWRSLWLYTVDTGEMSRLSPEGMNWWEAGWCGTGQVVTVASADPSEDSWYQAVLSLIDVGTARCRELLRSDVQFGLPTGSPDGAYVSVVQAVCSDRWIVAGTVTLIELESGAQTTVDTDGTDVTCLQWIDAGRLGYLGQRHLHSVAGIVDAPTGGVRELLSTEHACGGSFYPDGVFTADGRVATIQESYELPQRIVVTDGGERQLLATVAHPGTDYLSSVAGAARAVSWSAPDGLRIEGILCTPPGTGPFPLILNVHGGPVWAFRDTWSMSYPWVPLLVSRGYAVLNPNPRGSGGRGQEFARRVVGDMGGADTTDLLSGIDALVEQGLADPERIGVIGRSYGGYMAAWLITQDQRFAAAVSISPVTDWYSQSFTSNIAGWGNAFLQADPEQPGTQAHTRSPVLQASKVRTPCLNVAGAEDRCTPPGQAREFHHALRANRVESALVIYPREGHGVRSHPAVVDFLARVTSWFDTYMPAGLADVNVANPRRRPGC